METNEEGVVTPEDNGGEGEETVTVSKKDYDKLNQDFGSLKRDYKDLKKSLDKPKEEAKETPEKTKPDEALLKRLENMSLRQAGLEHPDDIDLAKQKAKKWNMDIEEVLVDADFKAQLERQQTHRANLEATSNVKGGGGSAGSKGTPEYWLSLGRVPTAQEVPDYKLRAKVLRGFMAKEKGTSGGKFYNT